MYTQDHYDTLGIARGEPPHGVHAAYRDLDRRHHPERTGVTRQHRRIRQAHTVLSDSHSRSSYDFGQLLERAAPEPLVPEPSEGDLELSLLEDFQGRGPTREDVRRWVRANFTHEALPKSGQIRALDLNVELRSTYVAGGRTLALGVPVFQVCANCHGSGFSAAHACETCGATGYVEYVGRASLRLPASAQANARYDLPLGELGIRNLHVRVQVSFAREDAQL
jgi:DnaJ-class molecular chaperone